MTETEIAQTNGNGHSATKPVKGDSALAKLLLSIKGQNVNETDKKKACEAFKKAMGKRAELQKALDDFDAASDATAILMVKCYGSKQILLGGTRYAPTSRGERVYYKRLGDVPPDAITL